MLNSNRLVDRRKVIAGSSALLAAVATGGCAISPVPEPSRTATTRASATVHGKVIRFRAETGETIMRNAAGTPRATIFSVSYFAEGVRPKPRPVTFIFNGGPGGATWPLREAIAPRVIGPAATPPGFTFVNNPDSLIDVSDLVFIDAPGTGYSRFLSEDAKSEYWGIQQDGRAFSQFIGQWLRNHGRMSSPKYLLGESYGGTRAGQILEMLAARPEGAIRFTGVVLISPALGTGTQDILNVVPNGPATLIPSEAAAAWYHRRGDYISESLEQLTSRAQTFAAGSYSQAIRQVERLDAAQKRVIAGEMAAFIGISTDAILESNLSVSISDFQDLLLAADGERVGGDSRQYHPKPPAAVKESVIQTAEGYDLGAAIVSVIRDELGYKAVGPYVRDPAEAHHAWNNAITSGQGTLPAILKTRTLTDTDFGVFLAGGYFDLVVPYFLPLSALTAANLPAAQFVHQVYPTGHAVLNDAQARQKATNDVRAFYGGSV